MKILDSRVDALIDYMYYQEVLDIGCCGMGTEDVYGGNNWIHGKICHITKKLVGVDIQRDCIKSLKKRGYNVRYANADKPFNLKEKFDVVVVEEVIEHLFDLRTFMQNVKRHLKPDGELIITSPNPQAFEFFLQKLFHKKNLVNPYHTHWQTEETMKYILDECGFELIEYFNVQGKAENRRGRIYQLLFRWLP